MVKRLILIVSIMLASHTAGQPRQNKNRVVVATTAQGGES